MIKYYWTGTDKEVKEGDSFSMKFYNSNGDDTIRFGNYIDRQLLNYFIETEMVEEREIEELDFNTVTSSIVNKFLMEDPTCMPYTCLNVLHTINPSSVLSLYLREISRILDAKYKNHIRESEQLFFVSLVDGRIHEVQKKENIKCYKHIALFRTLEDARYACRIMRNMLKEMYKNDRK